MLNTNIINTKKLPTVNINNANTGNVGGQTVTTITNIIHNGKVISTNTTVTNNGKVVSSNTVNTINPVKVQTTVVKKAPVIEIKAWRAGKSVLAAAAAIEEVPRPASLAKTPRAIPKRTAIMTEEPTKPPIAACPVKALATISQTAPGTFSIWIARTKAPPPR